MTALHDILDRFRHAAVTPREKGTYFEELTVCYLKNEPAYADLYREVLPYGDWAAKKKLEKKRDDMALARREEELALANAEATVRKATLTAKQGNW